MIYEKKPVIQKWDFGSGSVDTGEPSFETILDTTCKQLRERHIQYSIRRIQELEEDLARLEKELEACLTRT